MNMKLRLIVMNFLQYGIWGSYLICLGQLLGNIGIGQYTSWFYAVQGIVSIFMPAIIGAIADRKIAAQKLLGICHLLAAGFMLCAGIMAMHAMQTGTSVEFAPFFALYTLSVAFYMPTIALSNTVAYDLLEQKGLDTIKDFPPIRVFGTVGFICAELFVNFATIGGLNFQASYWQLYTCAALGLALGLYAFSLPQCRIGKAGEHFSLRDMFGIDAFALFKQKKMAIFFIFSMLLGVSLQITNAFATPFISSFKGTFPESWVANNSTALVSISQMAEAVCILLIPFFLKRFGIKNVMLIAMGAWVLRFGCFGLGNPNEGAWLFVVSCLVYGVAFDFFNVSGSLFVNQETKPEIRGAAQGLFMLMTNGIGATVGTLAAGEIINKHCTWQNGLLIGNEPASWETCWFIFAAYALVVAVMFAILFKYKHDPNAVKEVRH